MSQGQPGLTRQLGLAVLVMTGGVFLSRLTGHLREAIIIGLHGAGGATDAYYAAFTLPDLLNYMLAGGALSIAFLPIFADFLATGREEEGWRVFSTVATTMTCVMVVLVLLAELLCPFVVPWLVPGFPPDRLAQTVRLTRIVMPAQLAFYLGGLLQATLYARERFLVPALSPLVYNLCIIAGGVLLSGLGVEGFAWGVLVGAFLGPLLLPLLASWRSIRYRFRFSFVDPGVLCFVKLSIPLMLGFSLLSVDQWISRYFASGMVGSITHLDNARRLMLVPTAVLGQAAGMAALPFLARLHASGEREEMARVLGLALRGVLEVTMLAACWMAVAAAPVVMLVFGWGRNTVADVEQTALLLVAFAAGLPAWGIQGVAVRGFYARQDTFSPMLISSLCAACSLPLYWLLANRYGPLGLAMSTSIGMWLTAVATLLGLHLKGVHVHAPELLRTLLRGLVVAGLAGAVVWAALGWLGGYLDWQRPLHALLLLVSSLLLFGGLVLVCARPLGLAGVQLLMGKLGARVGRLGRA